MFVAPQELTELEYLNIAKRRFKEAAANVEEGWLRRDIAVEAHDIPLVHQWDMVMEILMALRDRSYNTLQLAHLRLDATRECQCIPDYAIACRACIAYLRLKHGDEIPWA